MRTVQMTLDEDLVRKVDKAAKHLHTMRSAFAREALRQTIVRFKTQELEQKHQQGFLRKPVRASEFGLWEEEQK